LVIQSLLLTSPALLLVSQCCSEYLVSFLRNTWNLPLSILFPYTTLFRSQAKAVDFYDMKGVVESILDSFNLDVAVEFEATSRLKDRKSTRLNSSHVSISYAVFCLKKKKRRMSGVQHQAYHVQQRDLLTWS